LFILFGGYTYIFNFLLAGVFQMVYSLEQSKADISPAARANLMFNWHCRASMGVVAVRLNWLGLVCVFFHGSGAWIACAGCYIARSQKGTDIFVAAGYTFMVIGILVLGCTCAYGALELRRLQKAISAESSSGKTLKKLLPVITHIVLVCSNIVVNMLLVPVIPWLRHRAGIIWVLLWAAVTPLFPLMIVYELQRLSKRKLAQQHAAVHKLQDLSERKLAQHQLQILPTSKCSHEGAVQTSAIANTIAATQQDLRCSKRSRMGPNSSSDLDSGVDLVFFDLGCGK
jgi:hypothetical protein